MFQMACLKTIPGGREIARAPFQRWGPHDVTCHPLQVNKRPRIPVGHSIDSKYFILKKRRLVFFLLQFSRKVMGHTDEADEELSDVAIHLRAPR